MFFSPSFKSITRNPEKLLFVIDHVLRHGGTLMTPNYLFSPTYLVSPKPVDSPDPLHVGDRGAVGESCWS